SNYTAMVYTERIVELGAVPSTGTVGVNIERFATPSGSPRPRPSQGEARGRPGPGASTSTGTPTSPTRARTCLPSSYGARYELGTTLRVRALAGRRALGGRAAAAAPAVSPPPGRT